MVSDVFIYTQREAFCLVRSIVLEKMNFLWFKVGACPNLKDSSLYERFSIHMYKPWSVWFLRYLRLSYALYGTIL